MSRPLAATLSILVLMTITAAGFPSCGPATGTGGESRPAGEGGWLTGTPHEKFNTIADQLGGFDQTMIEVTHRYVQLYWAGKDENWAYAEYQIEEMREALDRGFQRRPERRASADAFMNAALPNIEEAVMKRDATLFQRRFSELTVNCNACHAMEQVPFIVIGTPRTRPYPIGVLGAANDE